MSILNEKQFEFTSKIARLILYAESLGYNLTFGDAYAKDGHMIGSFHYKRLAVDFNLFRDGEYLKETEDHREIGEYWKKIGGTWGGDWDDGNHYSLGE